MSGWDQRGDIDDLAQRLRRERRAHRISSAIFLTGAFVNVAIGVIRDDTIQVGIGLFLLVVYGANRR